MSTAVSYLPTANAAQSQFQSQVSEAEIRKVFEAQRATALRLRTSTLDERLAKIKKLKAAMLAKGLPDNPETLEAAYHMLHLTSAAAVSATAFVLSTEAES